MHQKGADAEREEGLALAQGRLGHLAKHRGRRAFDDDVGVCGKLGERQNGHFRLEAGHVGVRFGTIARADGDEPQPRLSTIQPRRDLLPDRPESTNRHRQRPLA